MTTVFESHMDTATELFRSLTRELAEVERERDEARAEVARLKAALDDARELARDLVHGKCEVHGVWCVTHRTSNCAQAEAIAKLQAWGMW